MVQLIIATFVLFASILGMAVIIFQKIPVLATLPKRRKKREISIFLQLKKGVFSYVSETSPSYEKFLQKILSRVRILCLKTDCKTSTLLQKLREKSKRNNEKESDNYWEKLKKSTRGK